MSTESQRDDALFEALGKSKRQKKRRLIYSVLIAVLAIAVLLTVLISFLQRQVREQFASRDTEVEAYAVTTGTISTLVSGSGMLMNVDTESLTVPEGVEVTEILVEPGDTVEAGDLLATVDVATVRTALSDLQSEIQSLDSQISAAKSDSVAAVVSTSIGGRVKAMYAQEGDCVEDIMVEYGALAVISLDGYMAVDLETESLAKGNAVVVLREDGTALEGSVETSVRGRATILVTDDGPKLDEAVTVQTVDGELIGTGALYIHSPLAITGYAGTVKSIGREENAEVWDGTHLIYLKDTTHSANYDALLRSRSEKEETLLQLLHLQKYGGITAPVAGSVFSAADLDAEEVATEIVVLSPDVSMSVTVSVDEGDILALELEQEADVTVSSVSEDTLTGVVTEIDKAASDGAYTAEITLDKIPGMLQGMTASVDVKIQGVENAIIIPVDALHQTSTGAFVYTTYDEENQEYGGRVDVTTGLSNDNYVEITSGLAVGDTVYYTEAQSGFGMFGPMGNMGGSRGGQSSAFGSGQAPAMPSGGQMPGGQRPEGQMPGNRGQ